MDLASLYALFRQFPAVCIDSRKVKTGDLFFALKGTHFDGNRFALAALDQGAARAVVDDPAVVTDERFFLVTDTLKALQDLGRHHRRQFDIPVIGITGSNGKTTTKELVSAVLGSHYRVHFTQRNLNNHIGVPLTLLAMPLDTEVAVIEMGANHQGEIDALCRIAEPTHGLITNIGKAHLEGFGGIEGVKKGKSELYRFLAAHKGLAFINADEPFLTELAAPVQKKIFYLRSDHPHPSHQPCEIKLLASQPFVRAAFLDESGQLLEVKSQLMGAYNFNNIMTAVTLGRYFKVPSAKIRGAIEDYLPTQNRSQILHRGSNTFLLDAYNANPSSMQEALMNFRDLKAPHKIAILGQMLELGEEAEREHREIARLAQGAGLGQLILVGEAFASIAGAMGLTYFPDVAALREWFNGQSFEDTWFLLKGSRGVGLEGMLERS